MTNTFFGFLTSDDVKLLLSFVADWANEAPEIWNEKVQKAGELINEYDDMNYGNLHVEIDDYNLDDPFGEYRIFDGIFSISPEQEKFERGLHDFLKAMTEDERHSAMAVVDGYWKPEGKD